MDATPPDPTYRGAIFSNRPIPLPLSGVFGPPPSIGILGNLSRKAR
jgi:hypothetical protein